MPHNDTVFLAVRRGMAASAASSLRTAEARPPRAMTPEQAERRGVLYYRAGPVAIIPVEGILVPGTGYIGSDWMTGYGDLAAQFSAALADESVSVIAPLINSGGGMVSGLWELVDAMMSARGAKPMVALCENAYSAAYAIAAACDRIAVSPYGGVGSIGVVLMHMEMARAMEGDGVSVTILRAPEGKGRGGPFEALDDATRASLQGAVTELAALFGAKVAAGRAGMVTAEAALATDAAEYDTPSRLAEALRLGLVDAVAPLDDVLGEITEFSTKKEIA